MHACVFNVYVLERTIIERVKKKERESERAREREREREKERERVLLL